MLEKFKAAESRGQKELRQVTLTKTQLKNRCCRESAATLHKGQKVSELGYTRICAKRSLVGIIFQAIFQINNFSLSFKFNLQMDNQKELGAGMVGDGEEEIME